MLSYERLMRRGLPLERRLPERLMNLAVSGMKEHRIQILKGDEK
jgi:hypothetical protein